MTIEHAPSTNGPAPAAAATPATGSRVRRRSSLVALFGPMLLALVTAVIVRSLTQHPDE